MYSSICASVWLGEESNRTACSFWSTLRCLKDLLIHPEHIHLLLEQYKGLLIIPFAFIRRHLSASHISLHTYGVFGIVSLFTEEFCSMCIESGCSQVLLFGIDGRFSCSSELSKVFFLDINICITF